MRKDANRRFALPLRPFVALAVAGSDSCGGAGIAADLFAIRAQGVFPALALAAVTAQNTRGVARIHPVPPADLYAQIASVALDLRPRAWKTGMLFGAGQIRAVARAAKELDLGPLVLDPVACATSGARLLSRGAMKVLIEELFPLAMLVTPNLPEAETLAGMKVRTLSAMKEAAGKILALGPRAVLVKGGHLPGGRAVDLLATRGGVRSFASPRLDTRHTHGTGCALSAAIAARLALGESLPEAVRAARAWLHQTLRRPLAIGAGSGPGDYARRILPLRGR